MFSVRKYPFGKFYRIELSNNDTNEHVGIIPDFGANVNGLVLKSIDGLESIINGCKDHDELLQNIWFKGAKLIPFPNRINNGQYGFSRKRYSLPINFPSQNHAIHGLLFNKPFAFESSVTDERHAEVTLSYEYNNDVEGYPHHFITTIVYEISKEGFKCTTTVENIGASAMPFGDGWHPYFKLSIGVDDIKLKIPKSRVIEVDDRLIPTGKTTPYHGFSRLTRIGNQEFDTGFKVEEKGIAKTELKRDNKTIVVWQDTKGYGYLQVYIPPDRKSIAIEPMSCMTDAYNNKKGLIVLNPGQKFTSSYGVRLL